MELSTDLLANVTFREQWRGYSPDQVDEFLERLGVAIQDLQERVRVAERRASEAESSGDQDEIRRTLVLAQRTASAAVEEARQDAARILSEAEAAADERRRQAEAAATTREAEAEAAATAREAEAEAAATAREAESTAAARVRLTEAEEAATARLSEAESTASALLAAAEAKLAELEAEVARREREELGQLDERRDALVAEVEAMEAFLEEGRARLRAELRAQLAAVEAPGDRPPWVGTGRKARIATEATPEPAGESAGSGAGPTSGAVPAVDPAPEPAAGVLFDRAVEDPTGGLPLVEPPGDRGDAGDGGDEGRVVDPATDDSEIDDPAGDDSGPMSLDPGRADPVLARARADLADALREAGVLLEPGPNGPVVVGEEASPPAARAGDVSADDTGDAGGSAAGFDREGDVVDRAPAADPVQQEWRSVAIPDESEDDPFLAELRRAVTDTEPLGPREHDPTQEHRAFDEPESGRFRLRRNRG